MIQIYALLCRDRNGHDLRLKRNENLLYTCIDDFFKKNGLVLMQEQVRKEIQSLLGACGQKNLLFCRAWPLLTSIDRFRVKATEKMDR